METDTGTTAPATDEATPTAPVFPSELSLRAAAVARARFAVGGTAGRLLGDPVFEEVTEGRAHYPKYSSCGDLPAWMLRELGYRDERVLNRNDDGGVVPWKMGENLSRLVYRTGQAFVWARGDGRPKPGDVLYVAPPEHVCVLEWLDESRGRIATFDYGQWDSKVNRPAARARETSFLVIGKTLHVGNRVLRGWLDIARLPGLIAG